MLDSEEIGDDIPLFPNRRPLCCMEIHRGYIKSPTMKVIRSIEQKNRELGTEPWQFQESEIKYTEDWRRCKGYRVSGMIYCVAHRDQRIRNLFSAAQTIEKYYNLYRIRKSMHAKGADYSPSD